MKKMHRLGGIVLALLLAVGLTAAAAQAPNPVEGQLNGVDPDAMTIVILASDGNSYEISYTGDTEVTGTEGVAGLATAVGLQVRVEWDESTEVPTAVKIEVLG